MNKAELITVARSPEGLRAQTTIVHDIFDGTSLRATSSQPLLEQSFRGIIGERAKAARAEVTALTGIKHEKLLPAEEGDPVIFDTQTKADLLTYFTKRQQLLSNKPSKSNPTPPTPLAERFSMHMIGPLITITAESQRDFDTFSRLVGYPTGYVDGFFVPFLLPGTNSAKELNYSDTTLLLLQMRGAKPLGHDTRQHELWHAFDHVRSKLAESDTPSTTKLENHLTDYFFDPQTFVARVQLDADIPALLPLFYGYVPKEQDLRRSLERGFRTLQIELPACLAGYLRKSQSPETRDHQQAILVQNLLAYTPLKENSSTLFPTANVDGKMVVGAGGPQQLIDRGRRLSLKKNHPTRELWEALVNNYYTPDGQGILQLESDMQKYIDFFHSPGSAGYEATKRLQDQLGKSIAAYYKLSDYRQDPYVALTEISLIPISHWDNYVKYVMR